MNNEKKQYFDDILNKEKKIRTIDMNEDDIGKNYSLKNSTGELSSYDNHPGDLATETFEAEKNLSFHNLDKYVIEEIDHALIKIMEGSYGKCEECSKEINQERLEMIPYTRHCIECEKKLDTRMYNEENGRPIEEQSLYPPFARSNMDNSPEGQTGFDGEDTWQKLNTFNAIDSTNAEQPEDNIGVVEPVELISNEQYKKQL